MADRSSPAGSESTERDESRVSHSWRKALLNWRKALLNWTVLCLLVVAAALGMIGWALHPDTTSPAVPRPGSLLLVAAAGHRIHHQVIVREFLDASSSSGKKQAGPAGDNVSLTYEVEGDGLLDAGSWRVVADLPPHGKVAFAEGFTTARVSDVCQQRACHPPEPGLTRYTFEPTDPNSRRSSVLDLEWRLPTGLIKFRGGRIALALPSITLADEDDLTSGRFRLGASDEQLDVMSSFGPIGDFVIDAGLPPTSQDYDSWNWHSKKTRGTSAPPVVVSSAHSVGQEETQHRDEFVSGVLLGLAGASAIAALQELMNWGTRPES